LLSNAVFGLQKGLQLVEQIALARDFFTGFVLSCNDKILKE
jgi:hypothetical protein